MNEKIPNARYYETLESVNPPTKYLTNAMFIYMVPQFKPKNVLMLGYAAGTVAALIRLLYGNDIPITGVDILPCETTYGVKIVQADAKDYIKTCNKFDVIIIDMFDLESGKIPDFVFEEWFVKELAKKANYIIVDAFFEPKVNMKYYRKLLKRYGKNKPNRLANLIWYFGTKDYDNLIIK